MDCIIKNTKTVDEFKRVRASMEERAERYSRRHIASCEHWQDGLPVASGLENLAVAFS